MSKVTKYKWKNIDAKHFKITNGFKQHGMNITLNMIMVCGVTIRHSFSMQIAVKAHIIYFIPLNPVLRIIKMTAG